MAHKPINTNSKDLPYGAEKDLDRPTLWAQTSGNKKPGVSARTLRRAKARLAKKAPKQEKSHHDECCYAPVDMGHMDGCPNNPENITQRGSIGLRLVKGGPDGQKKK